MTKPPLIASPHWRTEDESTLRGLAQSGITASEIGKQLGRSEQAIRNRLNKLGISLKRIKTKGKAAPSERLNAAREFASAGAALKEKNE
jgi:hypothetical protein